MPKRLLGHKSIQKRVILALFQGFLIDFIWIGFNSEKMVPGKVFLSNPEHTLASLFLLTRTMAILSKDIPGQIWKHESGLKWTVLKVDGHVKLGGPSKNGRSQSKLDGYLNLSGHSRTILNGLSTQKFGAIPWDPPFSSLKILQFHPYSL